MPISIEQEGGVDEHIKNLGFDPIEFNRRMELKEPYTVIARALEKEAGKRLHYKSVSKWAKVWVKEHKQVG